MRLERGGKKKEEKKNEIKQKSFREDCGKDSHYPESLLGLRCSPSPKRAERTAHFVVGLPACRHTFD